jgi:threonine synthase
MPGFLFTVEGVNPDKLAHVQAFDTDVWEVEGFGRNPEVDARVFDAVARFAAAEDLIVGITARAYNPTAMDGVKAIALELIEDLGTPPAAVYVPTGGGGLLATLAVGFEQARHLGLTGNSPKLVAVQPEGCAPIHLAAQRGLEQVTAISECRSDISGLQLTNPPDGTLALQAVRASGGWTTAVSDADAMVAQRTLATEHGIFVEQAAALAFAAYQAAPIEDAVVLMTGNGLKGLGEANVPTPPGRLTIDAIPSMLAAATGHPDPG